MAEEARIKLGLMEKFLYTYRSYQRAKWDEKDSLEFAREEGKIETLLEIAQNMKNEGVSSEIIARSTGLSEEEITKL